MSTLPSTSNSKVTQVKRSYDLWSIGALPLLAIGLVSGFLGVYWDIAWHIDKGRDSFWSPPHIFIYTALLSVIVVSIYTIIRDRRESLYHIKVLGLRIQPGILIVLFGAVLDIAFAPADELWHRLYGIDVSLWGPMHLVALLALTTACTGGIVASWLERNISIENNRKSLFASTTLFFTAALLTLHMLWLSEYAYGIPVFPVWVHIALLSSLPTVAFVLIAKLHPNKWSATICALIYTALHFILITWLGIADSQFNWGGTSQPIWANVILTAVIADLLIKRVNNNIILGIVLALVSFGANLLFFEFVQVNGVRINWHIQAIMLGLPVACVLSIFCSYLSSAMAKALSLKNTGDVL